MREGYDSSAHPDKKQPKQNVASRFKIVKSILDNPDNRLHQFFATHRNVNDNGKETKSMTKLRALKVELGTHPTTLLSLLTEGEREGVNLDDGKIDIGKTLYLLLDDRKIDQDLFIPLVAKKSGYKKALLDYIEKADRVEHALNPYTHINKFLATHRRDHSFFNNTEKATASIQALNKLKEKVNSEPEGSYDASKNKGP